MQSFLFCWTKPVFFLSPTRLRIFAKLKKVAAPLPWLSDICRGGACRLSVSFKLSLVKMDDALHTKKVLLHYMIWDWMDINVEIKDSPGCALRWGDIWNLMEGKETEKHLPGDLKITWHLFRSPSERFHFTKLRCIHFGIGFQISRLDCFLWLHFFCCKRISTELLRNVLYAVTASTYFATFSPLSDVWKIPTADL